MAHTVIFGSFGLFKVPSVFCLFTLFFNNKKLYTVCGHAFLTYINVVGLSLVFFTFSNQSEFKRLSHFSLRTLIPSLFIFLLS